MTINNIIKKYYNKFYRASVKHNSVISQGRTPEDLLNDVCLTALKKFKGIEITEEEGLNYLKKTLANEKHFQWCRKKNEMIIYTDNLPDIGYYHSIY